VVGHRIGEREQGEAGAELTVLVADDHAGYRAGLTRAIGAWKGLRLVAEAGDGVSALRLIEECDPDLALIDVRMPELTGLELCAQLKPEHRTRVVLLSAFMDERLAAQALASGATDCMSKDTPREQICRKLIAIADRGSRSPTSG
jgi:two-component system nitrate/nitrite response regulator NarL